MGPTMFPRIHVNDTTEKGGPRAPPRNKMALYEQLTIPSNRFTHAAAASLVHPPTQGATNERDMFFSYNLHTRPQPEKQYTHYHESNTPPTQFEHKKNVEDDNFTVPIFVHSVPNQECGRYTNFNHHLKYQKIRKSYTLENEQEVESRKGENFTDRILQTDSNDSVESEHCAEYKPDSKRCNSSVLDENIADLEKRNNFNFVEAFLSEDRKILLDGRNKTEFQDRPCGSQNTRNSDSLSENSVVDSIYGHDITPDDVIGFIGHKHFWKARRQFINQQRIFADQVFELHRLIKVQRLIAASPHVFLEGSAYFTKPIKASPAKRKPLNDPIKEITYVPQQKGEPEKPIHNNKSSSKNATEKAPFSSVQARAVSGDYNSGPWGFNPPPLGNQWLIPVMSPSEGLVYKPYSGPGLVVGPEYGFCGPSGLNPLMGNFPIPAYGVPSLHGYLPPYGMPITNGLPFLDQISAHYRNLYAIPGRENRASPDVLNTLEDIESQASIASSSVERRHDCGESKSTEERNVLTLFPTSPPSDGPGLGPKQLEPEHPTQVIKAVPHNARSASESAARIFKSIQEGRKQCDWV